MANSMKQELIDEVTAPSGVKSRISKRPSDPLGGVAEPASRSEQGSALGSVPVPALAQQVASPFAPRPVGTLVSASAVKSAVMPARVSVPVPPRPALKTQVKAATRSPAIPESKSLESRVANHAPRSEPEAHSQEVATTPPPAKRDAVQANREPPPSERTQIYRPNLTDPNLRRSNAPDSPFDTSTADQCLPKQPRLPAEVPASRDVPSSASAAQFVTDLPDPEDCTVSLTSDALDRMIHDEKNASHPQSCAADEVTRAAEIPVEALVALQRGASNKGVGHDDVTRVYESPQREQTSDVTSPGQRHARQQANVQIITEPRVVIKPEQPKRHVGRWVFLGLCVAALAAGWVYRAPVAKQARLLQQSIVRGIGGPAAAKVNQAAAVANVAVSISVSPADAKLTLDGNLVTNPYTAQLRPDRKQHTLVVEATGFATLERSFSLERDLTVVLALAPLPQQPAAAPAAAAPATAAAPAPVAAPAAPAVAARVVRPVKAAKPAPAPARGADCDPPYVVDAAGIKTFKPECM